MKNVFKIGDKVKVIRINSIDNSIIREYGKYVGEEGIIVNKTEYSTIYRVKIDGTYFDFKWEELQLVKKCRLPKWF